MLNRNLNYFIVDVFAEKKYAGNQLAVFTDAGLINTEEMAAIARETNFSETTFITGCDLNNQIVDVRIFTPGGEIDFAGHPTLGTAYVANKVFFNNQADKVTLNLKVGNIPVVKENNLLWMDQIQPIFGQNFELDLMAELLGLESSDLDERYPIEYVSTGLPFFIVPVKSLDGLRRINVDMQKAKMCLKDFDTGQMLVFAPEAYFKEDEIACRVFVPSLGIPEDPATGSANGCLAAYLLKHNVLNSSEIKISVAQGYEINRPSRLHLKATLKESVFSLKIGGKVFEIAEGRWY